MSTPFKMNMPSYGQGKNPIQKSNSPMHKEKGTYKTTTDEDGNKSKVYLSKNKKKAFISSDFGNTIEKRKDGGIFRPNTTKSKKVNLTTGTTTITKRNSKTGKITVTNRKINKGDSKIVKKGRKKTTPPTGTKIA